MRVLAIDTTGPACSVALVDCSASGVRVAGRIVTPMQRGHAEALMPMLDQLLETTGAARSTLDRVAVTIGPGSFTGLRVGVAAARAIALALAVPVVGVSVFEVMHAMARTGAAGASGSGELAVVLDAKRDEIYVQVFAADGEPTGAYAALRVDDAREVAAKAATVVGSAAGLLGWPDAPDLLPLDPVALAVLGARRDPAQAPPDPLYIRKPDAKPQSHVALPRA